MIEDLLRNNKRWAADKTTRDPEFFARLVAQQSPDYLWIGCSDSHVPANDIVGLDPGELLVHHNVANIACPSDANFLSVLQFAVDRLKVRHVIVCGHYGCGGVAAAMSSERHGLIDHWLQPIRDVADEFAEYLLRIREEDRRLAKLCEANVVAQVRNVACNPIIHDAWRRSQPVTVHGWVYAVGDGFLRNLEVTIASFSDLSEHFPRQLSAQLGPLVNTEPGSQQSC